MKSRTDADEIRLRHLYRKMILMGKAKVSFETARRLVGPDCAYHLYGTMSGRRRMSRSNKKAGRKEGGRT